MSEPLPFDFDEEVAAPVGERTWTVGQLADRVSSLLAEAFPDQIWVEGEIANLQRPKSGHVYFTLVDADPDTPRPDAALGVTLFSHQKEYVNRVLRRAGGSVRMDDGVRIRIKGTVEHYARKGEVRLRMTSIDPAYTLGTLASERDRVLAQLRSEGLLGRNAALTLVQPQLRIGLVTSSGSAAHHDVMAELDGTAVGFEVVLVDARVQGADAPASLVAALTEVVRHRVDVVLLVRGGGARTDLAAFDHESVARAVAVCPVPVFTGVGHEIDTTAVDTVAHAAHKTPTAAAAAVALRAREAVAHLEQSQVRLTGSAVAALRRADERLTMASRHVVLGVRADLLHAGQSLNAAANRARQSSAAVLDRAGHHLDATGVSATERARRALRVADAHLTGAGAAIRANDPRRTLARGYSITRQEDGRVVTSIAALAPGALLRTEMSDGEVGSTVTTLHPATHPITSDGEP